MSTGLANDEVTARADAVRIAEDFEPFVVLGGPALTSAFADELAAREVMCIGCTPGQPPEWYAERDPYVWGLAISAAQARTHAREFIAKQLVGGNAEHAGDEAFATQPRKFGHVYISSSPESQAIADEFIAGLTEDGADIAEVLPYTLDPDDDPAQASQIIAKLKASGVTTVVLASDGIAPRDLTNEATAQEYFPEWVIVAPALSDLTAFGRTYDQTQWAHAFGVTHGAAPVTPEIAGYYGLYQWFMGKEAPAKDTIGLLMPNYTLLAAMLQATGPNLTPETWRDALFAYGGTQAGHQPAVPHVGRQGVVAGRRLQRCRRRHHHLVGSRSDRTRRDPQGRHRHVHVRRRRQAIPAGRMADGVEAVRPRGRGDAVRRTAARRSTTVVPQPRRLTRVRREHVCGIVPARLFTGWAGSRAVSLKVCRMGRPPRMAMRHTDA